MVPHPAFIPDVVVLGGLRGASDVALAVGPPQYNIMPPGMRTGVEPEAASSTNGEFGSLTAWYDRDSRKNSRDRRSSEGFLFTATESGRMQDRVTLRKRTTDYNHQLPELQVRLGTSSLQPPRVRTIRIARSFRWLQPTTDLGTIKTRTA